MGNSQTVAKFTLPKEHEKNYYLKQKKKLDDQKKKAQTQSKPKNVDIGDIITGKNEAAAS